MTTPLLDCCRKCGAIVFLGERYCKSCAEEEGDYTGYIDVSDIPEWVPIAMAVVVGTGGLTLLYLIIKHYFLS